MIITNTKDYLPNFYNFQPKSDSWYAGSKPIIDSEGDEDQEIVTPLNSSWIDFVQYNIDANIATIYFDVFATNGKEPVVLLGPNAIEKAKGLIAAGSPGRYYLSNIALGSGGIDTSLFSLVEKAVADLGKDLIPEVLIKFIDKSKRLLNVLKTPVIAATRYATQKISTNVAAFVGLRIFPSNIASTIINKYFNLLESFLYKAEGFVKDKAVLKKIWFKKFELGLEKVLKYQDKIPAAVKGSRAYFVREAHIRSAYVGAQYQAVHATLLSFVGKILQFISLASLVVVLPLQIGLSVSNDIKALKSEENRIKKLSSLDKREDIDFTRKMTNLKVNLAFAASLTPKGLIQKGKSRATLAIKNTVPKQVRDIDGKFDSKINNIKQGIYKENKGLTKLKSLKEQKTRSQSNIRTIRSAPKKVVRNYRTIRR